MFFYQIWDGRQQSGNQFYNVISGASQFILGGQNLSLKIFDMTLPLFIDNDHSLPFLWFKVLFRLIVLLRASEVGSPTNHPGSRQRQDTGPGILT